MKEKIKYILGLFMVAAFLLSISSCNKDEYDFNKIIPGIAGIDGPTTVIAGGLAPSRYIVVAPRTGSTYSWKVVGHSATIEAVKKLPWAADITFEQASQAVPGVEVIVTETTQGGLTATDTITVDLLPFCPKTIDWFVGTWTGTETDANGTTDVTVVIEKENETTIRAKAVSGHPPFLQAVYAGWGETFQPGHGLEGDVLINVGLNDGSLSLDLGTYWGQTLPGPYDYWYSGDGGWDGCKTELTVNFNMHWSQDFSKVNRSCVTVLTAKSK